MISDSPIEYRKWNRIMLNFYWFMIGFIFIIGEITFVVSGESDSWILGDWIRFDLFLLIIVTTFLMIVTELLYHWIHYFFDYILITIGFIIAISTMIISGKLIHGLQITLVIPMVASIFYFSHKHLWFAGLMTLSGFFLFYSIVDTLQQQIDFINLTALISTIIGISIIGHAIRRRGLELLNSLERAVNSERALLVDTIALEYVSKRDHLTGLFNHISFHEYLSLLIQQYEANEFPLHLAIVDIDNFKQINDKFGHQKGDEVLRKLGQLFNESISMDDVAARYGGEEFALILTNKSPEQSMQILENIREIVAAAEFSELDNHKVTISAGLTGYEKQSNKDLLFQKADSLLYKAKHHGKNVIMSDFEMECSHDK